LRIIELSIYVINTLSNLIFWSKNIKKVKMKKNIILALLAGQLIFSGCGSSAVEEYGVILKIEDVVNKSLPDVEKLLGKSESSEKVKGYPCENSDCKREVFQDGKYEIIFKEGKADRITINKVPNLTGSVDAIETLGLPQSEPSFINEDNSARWENINDIKEISFSYDFILV
jgi:hypothetical protein